MTQAAAPFCLENDVIRLAVSATGTLTAMHYRGAIDFPLISERGAGVAGSGEFFVPEVRIDGARSPLAGSSLSRPAAGEAVFVATASGGLAWRRRLVLAPGRSECVIEDVLRNDAASVRSLEYGARSRQQAEPWRLAERCWIGDEQGCREFFTSTLAAATPGLGLPPSSAEVAGEALFWRQVGQYGTGYLCRVRLSGGQPSLRADLQPGDGHPVQIAWHSGRVELPPGGALAVTFHVTLDEGGGAPDQQNAFAAVLARADFAAAGRVGVPLHGFASVVSPAAREVEVTVAADREIARQSVALLPGRVERIPISFVPAAAGQLAIRVTVAEGGEEVACVSSPVVIDGDAANPVWRNFTRRVPEEHYRGTWAEIGAQLVQNRVRIGGPTTLEFDVRPDSSPDRDVAFYARHVPFYADLVSGLARAAGAEPSAITLVKRGMRDKPTACMDVACYGPDGPINAFSKERDGPEYEGLGYVRVVPAQGYAFHVYMHHGVNEHGLSISGATLNEDAATAAAADRTVAERKRAGGHTLPPAAGTWLMLAMCRNVDEALALMQNPEVPWESTGNLLLLDRSGACARVESARMDRQIFRHAPGGPEFFAAGNYPHARADGRFQIGPRWGHAANTQLRERFLRDFAGARQGGLSRLDVFSLMQSHEAGGMCQHHHDNPGELYTCCSSIAMTRTSDLWLTQGPPCQVGYVRYALGG